MDPNLTFLIVSTFLRRSGNHRAAALYATLVEDYQLRRGYQTGAGLGKRLNASRNELVASMDKLVDWGVVLPSEAKGARRRVILASYLTPRFVFWALETFHGGFGDLRALAHSAANVPLGELTYDHYGYWHERTPLPPIFAVSWQRLVDQLVPSGSDEGCYIELYGADQVVPEFLHQLHIITTNYKEKSNYYYNSNSSEKQAIPASLEAAAKLVEQHELIPVEPSEKAKTTRTKKRATPGTKSIKNSFSARYRPMADIQLLEPGLLDDVTTIINHWNTCMKQAVRISPFSFSDMRNLLVENMLPKDLILQAITGASRDKFWRDKGILTVLRPGRIEQLAKSVAAHDRYARDLGTEAGQAGETREF